MCADYSLIDSSHHSRPPLHTAWPGVVAETAARRTQQTPSEPTGILPCTQRYLAETKYQSATRTTRVWEAHLDLEACVGSGTGVDTDHGTLSQLCSRVRRCPDYRLTSETPPNARIGPLIVSDFAAELARRATIRQCSCVQHERRDAEGHEGQSHLGPPDASRT